MLDCESVAGRSWHWYLFHKDLRASKRANHISNACLLSFPACKTATQGIHRALQAKHRPLISSAQNLTIFLVSITSSPQIVSIVPVNKDTIQNKSASTLNHNYKEEIRTLKKKKNIGTWMKRTKRKCNGWGLYIERFRLTLQC